MVERARDNVVSDGFNAVAAMTVVSDGARDYHNNSLPKGKGEWYFRCSEQPADTGRSCVCSVPFVFHSLLGVDGRLYALGNTTLLFQYCELPRNSKP
jgi:hypothetical protein